MTGLFHIATGNKELNPSLCHNCGEETKTNKLGVFAVCKECKNVKGVYAGEK